MLLTVCKSGKRWVVNDGAKYMETARGELRNLLWPEYLMTQVATENSA
ncbi:hypothetical protein [Ruegeria atlantica]|nr:hypothetical protein [Ruegeria atlantica]